jgi:transcriptional regulator with XRE-family HTH domain
MVGARLRARRLEVELSQQELAKRIGITFQQVQKYESGSNRISAGRLKDISEALGVPIAYFFTEGGDDHARKSWTSPAWDLMKEPGARKLLRAYAKLNSPTLRKSVLHVVQGLAGQGKDKVAKASPRPSGVARKSKT